MPTALITGASVGIGYELAKCFARDHYELILVARNPDRLQEVAKECGQLSGAVTHVFPKDLAQPTAARELYDEVQGKGLHVDVLVNNAGFGIAGRFDQLDTDTQLKMIQVNVASLVHLTRLFLPAMLESRRTGSGVLNVASTAGFQPGPYFATYYATKAFVLSFSEAIAHELRHTGVTVTALCPGPTHTEFQKRSGMQSSRMFEAFPFVVQDAATVARTGYFAFQRGRRVVVSGWLNKLQTQSVRLGPRWLVARIAAAVNRSRH